MCAYFFAVSRPVNTDFTSEEHNKLKKMITNPLFNELTQLSSETKVKYTFDRENISHLNVIKDCTRIAQQKLEDSVAIDKEAALAFLAGVTSMAGFVPFSWVITPLAFIYCGYLVKERIPAYEEYTKSLEDLVRCAAWALSDVNQIQANMADKDIQNMITLLTQVMTKKQLGDIIVDSPIEDAFFVAALKKEELLSVDFVLDSSTKDVFDAAFKKSDTEKQKNLSYTVYGYKQGGSLAAMATKIASYLQVMLRQAAATSYQYLSEMSASTTAGM